MHHTLRLSEYIYCWLHLNNLFLFLCLPWTHCIFLALCHSSLLCIPLLDRLSAHVFQLLLSFVIYPLKLERDHIS